MEKSGDGGVARATKKNSHEDGHREKKREEREGRREDGNSKCSTHVPRAIVEDNRRPRGHLRTKKKKKIASRFLLPVRMKAVFALIVIVAVAFGTYRCLFSRPFRPSFPFFSDLLPNLCVCRWRTAALE